jgi:hypothetical protein
MCAIVTAIACGDSTAPTASVAGTWSLVSVNGTPLPYTLSQGDLGSTQITSGKLVVSRAWTFTDSTTVTSTFNGQKSMATAADSGSYLLSGNSVKFVFAADAVTGTGLLSGDSVTVALRGFSLVYTKE